MQFLGTACEMKKRTDEGGRNVWDGKGGRLSLVEAAEGKEDGRGGNEEKINSVFL